MGSAEARPAAAAASAWLERRALAGPSLTLSPLEPDDAADFMNALGDSAAAQAVTAHLGYDPPATLEQARDTITRLTAPADRVVYAQRITGTGEFVGVTSFYEVDPTVRSLAIGQTWVARRHWRTGVNTESKLVMLTRAFDGLGAERVVWHTDIRNLRSQAAIERLGAVREGVLRHHKIRRDGSWRDTVQYSMLSAEWPSAKARLTAALAAHHEPERHGAQQTRVDIVRNDAASRFEGHVDGQLVATIDFVDAGHLLVVTHTVTAPAWRGRHIAAQLTRFALDDARGRGQRVRPDCPYTAAFMAKHPEDRDLLA